jgi:dTDP-4-dehydrorhamnose reductase
MIKNTIWITGSSGRLGSALVEMLRADVENKVIGTDCDIDITDSSAVTQFAEMYRPTIVINCASLSDTKYCEENMVEAFKVNALGARNLAVASRHVNAKIIQFSTDDIFDGNTSGFVTEYDMPNTVSVYGKSKLAGENYVRELNPKHLIIRSSWVYGIGKGDYFSYVAEHGKNNEKFDAPMDHISTPTSVSELSNFIAVLIDQGEYGTFNASCEGACTRYAFAQAILAKLGYDPTLVNGVLSADGRQISTVLENLMMKMTEIYEMPEWHDCLDSYVGAQKEV